MCVEQLRFLFRKRYAASGNRLRALTWRRASGPKSPTFQTPKHGAPHASHRRAPESSLAASNLAHPPVTLLIPKEVCRFWQSISCIDWKENFRAEKPHVSNRETWGTPSNLNSPEFKNEVTQTGEGIASNFALLFVCGVFRRIADQGLAVPTAASLMRSLKCSSSEGTQSSSKMAAFARTKVTVSPTHGAV